MMSECIFCKIVAGVMSAAKVYEDDDVLAFMDIAPIDRGHTLVIPKKHYNPITDTPDEVLGRIMVVVRKIAAAQMKSLKADGINIAQANGAVAGQVVEHIHFHAIPRYENGGHSWNSPLGKYETIEEMAQVANLIRSGLV
mgnify:CR=1 FL=1